MGKRARNGTYEGFDSDHGPSREELVAAVRARAAEFADMLAAFFVESGLPQSEAAEILAGCAQRTRRARPTLSVDSWTAWAQLSEAVCDWWRDARYVGPDGRPRAIDESGPAPSIDALLNEHVDPAYVAEAKVLLRRCVRVLPDRRWMFLHNAPQLPLRGEHGVHRLQVSMTGLLLTFLENYLSQAPTSQKNFEASAGSVSFPASMVPAFRVQMSKFLTTAVDDVDAWITRHAASGGSNEVAEIGVEMFVFTFPPRRPPRARRLKEGRASNRSRKVRPIEQV